MDPIRSTLAHLTPPQFGDDLEERRARVFDWLRFVRDFGSIDTSPLIVRAERDDAFIDAVEAVAATESTAAGAYDAIRSFAVQLLLREPAPAQECPSLSNAPRVSPYSVPLEMLGQVFDTNGPDPFNLHAINTWTAHSLISAGGKWTQHLSNGELALLTTIRCRLFPLPETPIEGELCVHQLAVNRMCRIPLLAATLDYVPLFIAMSPNDGFEISLDDVGDDGPLVSTTIEGWRYPNYI
jgi:hypothetical protein